MNLQTPLQMNKTVSACIALFLTLAASLAAQTASDFETALDGGVVVITRYTGQGGNVRIPAAIDGNPVTGIGDWAFYGCSGLTSVTIPDGVIDIGEGAFYSCSGLTSMTIPASVTGIGVGAFSGCSGMRVISVLPKNRKYKDIAGALLTKDGKTLHTYPAGNARTAYTIPASVISIGEGAFSGCSGLTSVTMQPGVTTIGDWAFAYCDSLTSVTIPASVTSIGEAAFVYCSSLRPDLRADIERRFGSGVFR